MNILKENIFLQPHAKPIHLLSCIAYTNILHHKYFIFPTQATQNNVKLPLCIAKGSNITSAPSDQNIHTGPPTTSHTLQQAQGLLRKISSYVSFSPDDCPVLHRDSPASSGSLTESLVLVQLQSWWLLCSTQRFSSKLRVSYGKSHPMSASVLMTALFYTKILQQTQGLLQKVSSYVSFSPDDCSVLHRDSPASSGSPTESLILRQLQSWWLPCSTQWFSSKLRVTYRKSRPCSPSVLMTALFYTEILQQAQGLLRKISSYVSFSPDDCSVLHGDCPASTRSLTESLILCQLQSWWLPCSTQRLSSCSWTLLAVVTACTYRLQLGRAEVFRGLRNFLNMDTLEHHSIDRLKERGVEKGSGRHSTLQGRERFVFNQTNIGTVSRVTLGRLLRDGVEHVWAFPRATMPSWAETETEVKKNSLHFRCTHTHNYRKIHSTWNTNDQLTVILHSLPYFLVSIFLLSQQRPLKIWTSPGFYEFPFPPLPPPLPPGTLWLREMIDRIINRVRNHKCTFLT